MTERLPCKLRRRRGRSSFLAAVWRLSGPLAPLAPLAAGGRWAGRPGRPGRRSRARCIECRLRCASRHAGEACSLREQEEMPLASCPASLPTRRRTAPHRALPQLGLAVRRRRAKTRPRRAFRIPPAITSIPSVLSSSFPIRLSLPRSAVDLAMHACFELLMLESRSAAKASSILTRDPGESEGKYWLLPYNNSQRT